MASSERNRWFGRWPSLLSALAALLLSGCGEAGDVAPNPWCSLEEPLETDGYRRLVLIVGVGQYKNDRVPDLRGPTNDARSFYDLLTGKNGYGFPKANVCMLLDEQATTARFKEMFDKALVQRARSGDVAVLYYAGHGSQTRDLNGDEPDEWDETLMLHDARTGGVHDLVDDELNQMLGRLLAKTQRVSVIFDSCNSGTAIRGDASGRVAARFFQPDAAVAKPSADAAQAGDGGGEWVAEDLTGINMFSAASDGNPALEINGHGIFTQALVRVLGQVGEQPPTYAQVARQVPPLVAADSTQIPYFHGDPSGIVFGNKGRTRPVSWEVIEVGPPVKLGGPPLPGIGVGAELRVYPGSAQGGDTRDPAKAKATAVVQEMQGVTALAQAQGAAALEAGDLAVLVRPADAFVTLKLSLRPEGEPGGIPAALAADLRSWIEQNPEAGMLVEITSGSGDFELSLGVDGRLLLRGPENRIRNSFSQEQAQRKLPRRLWLHARQRALQQLAGETGEDFVDDKTLGVSLVPARKQNPCADGVWRQAPPNQEQIIPLCHSWNLRVTLSKDSPVPLLVGALILSSDGGIFALPRDGRKVRLQPGESVTFDSRRESFDGIPPLHVRDRVLVFGTQESNPVAWGLFAQTAEERTRGGPMGGLARALDLYLKPGSRGVGESEEGPVEDTTWTMSTLTMRVEANPGFAELGGSTDAASGRREYTIADFDIRPYLPDDQDTALYKVLEVVDHLANASARDGYGYKQHGWDKGTDEENLKLGIDCSRAIWFAFTRAGLPYNDQGDRYLNTQMMAAADSPMQDQFESCSDDPNLRIGDVLVYRDKTRGDGHVVMVIDPQQRIAWGSHGWDGNPKVLPVEPDTGVEYQKIKYKQDWLKWDRRTMRRAACWRYRGFAEEQRSGRGLPGERALQSVCDSKRRCGLM